MEAMEAKIDYTLQYRKWHDDSLDYYQSKVPFYRDLMAPFVNTLDKKSPVLDYGCGTGLLVNALRELGFENVAGIDISAEQIAMSKKHIAGCDVIVDLADYCARHEKRYGTIFFMDVLEHIDRSQQIQTIKRLEQLTQPGGKLVISVPNANSSFSTKWLYQDWTHHIAFDENSLEFVLRNSGYDDIQFYPYEFIKRPRLPFIPRKSTVIWWLHKTFRLVRRLQAVAELGGKAWRIPLGLNLLAVATRKK